MYLSEGESSSCSNVKVTDLAIPDTYCNPDMDSGLRCPPGMICADLSLSRKERGFNGFDEFGKYVPCAFLHKQEDQSSDKTCRRS